MAKKRAPPTVTNIRLGPYDIPVRYVERLENRAGERLLGAINMDEKKLDIDTPLPLLTQAHCLWHEIIHSFSHLTGREHFDESTINALAHFILDVMRRNPEFVELCTYEDRSES